MALPWTLILLNPPRHHFALYFCTGYSLSSLPWCLTWHLLAAWNQAKALSPCYFLNHEQEKINTICVLLPFSIFPNPSLFWSFFKLFKISSIKYKADVSRELSPWLLGGARERNSHHSAPSLYRTLIVKHWRWARSSWVLPPRNYHQERRQKWPRCLIWGSGDASRGLYFPVPTQEHS